jgi:hypothetical protein
VNLSSPFFRIIFSVLLLVAPSLWAQDGLQGAVSMAGNVPWLVRSPFGPELVAADFDNDSKPDGALLLDAGVIRGQRVFRVELHFSSAENRNLTLVSNDAALVLSALDVNRDGTPDLIVEEAFTHKRLQVWLNDGQGGFRQARVEDFPPLADGPYRWKAPIAARACFVLGLPSRVETHRALLLLQIIRFDSSSSHWRVRPGMVVANELNCQSHSPRAPPVTFPL